MYCLLLGAAARQFIALAWCLGIMKARQEGTQVVGKMRTVSTPHSKEQSVHSVNLADCNLLADFCELQL